MTGLDAKRPFECRFGERSAQQIDASFPGQVLSVSVFHFSRRPFGKYIFVAISNLLPLFAMN
jgi:hypothetical protein